MNTQRPTDTSGAGTAQGSSTGAPGAPTGVQDTRSQYDPLRTGYNPSTGAGYSTASAGGPHQHHHQPASPSNSYDQTAGQDDRIQHAPSTAQRVKMEEEQEGDSTSSVASLFARKGEDVGRSVKGTIAGIHVRPFTGDCFGRAATDLCREPGSLCVEL